MDSVTITHQTCLIPEPVRDLRELVVLALPGAGCSPRIYEGIRYQASPLYALDWSAGTGPFDPLSVAGRISAALRERAGPTVLVGHSMGGFIALLIAIESPECVQGLILSNTGAHTAGHGDPHLPNQIQSNWNSEAQANFLRACFLAQPVPALWAHLLDYLARLPASTLLEAVRGLRQLDMVNKLPQVACPTLVAHGQFDLRRSVDAARQLVDGIAHAQLVLLPGGHTPMVDCPTEYQSAVNAFLALIAGKTTL